MKAIFIGGIMDGRVEMVRNPPPRSVFAVVRNDAKYEGDVSDPAFKQIEYQRTLSSDDSLVYVLVGWQPEQVVT
jgi:hypothetical protein